MGEKSSKGRGLDAATDALHGLVEVLDPADLADFDPADVAELLGQEGMGGALMTTTIREGGTVDMPMLAALTDGTAADQLAQRIQPLTDDIAELGIDLTKE